MSAPSSPRGHAVENDVARYEPCVVDSEGNCSRWSHDHPAREPGEAYYVENGWSGCAGSAWCTLSPAAKDGWAHAERLVAGLRYRMAEAWDEGRRAERRDWEFTFDLVTPDEDRQPLPNPYRVIPSGTAATDRDERGEQP